MLARACLVALLVCLTSAQPQPERGVLCFRGNPSRTYYGRGPVPQKPVVRWKATLEGSGEWRGTGWTGQPAVVRWTGWPHWEVIVGGLDGRIHFLDGLNGEHTRPAYKLPRGGSIKGSVTVDPDGLPLLFVGNRGGYFWGLSLLGQTPTPILQIAGALDPRTEKNAGYWPDFDSSALVVDRELFVCGENGWVYKIPLWRQQAFYEPERVVRERKLWQTVYTPHLSPLAFESLKRSGGYCSIESSPAVTDRRIYLATGAGMVLGLNRETLKLEFQFSTGDDTDASVVVNQGGYLFVAAECDYGGTNQTSLYKLDPNVPPDQWSKAVLWSRTFAAYPQKGGASHFDNLDAGILGTPALGPGPGGEPEARLYVAVATRPGKEGWLACLDSRTGATIWARKSGSHSWSSPVVVDGRVILGWASGQLCCYRATDGQELWRVQLGGVIESTAVVWRGWIYVGTRDGSFYALADPALKSTQR